MNGKQYRALTTTNYDKWSKIKQSQVTFNSIHYKQWSWWWPSGRDKSHSPAATAGHGHWRWSLEEGTGETGGMGNMEGLGAPVAALEWGLGQTHRRGLSGLSGCVQRTEAVPGCGSGSAGGCSGILLGNWVWRPTWLWAAAGPGPDRRGALWWAESQWNGPGSFVGPLLGTSPGDKSNAQHCFLT